MISRRDCFHDSLLQVHFSNGMSNDTMRDTQSGITYPSGLVISIAELSFIDNVNKNSSSLILLACMGESLGTFNHR